MSYQITKPDVISQLKDFFQSLNIEQPICLIYDDDADGMCSAISFCELCKQIGFKKVYTFAKFKERNLFSLDFIEDLIQKDVKTIFCLDFEPLSWKMLTHAQLQTLPFNLVVIDHHTNEEKWYDSISNNHTQIYLHPRLITDAPDASQYCCAKFVFDICNMIQDISHIEWKILPGMIGDMNIIKWSEYIKKISAKAGVFIDDKPDSFFISPFGKFAQITAFAAKKGYETFENCFEKYQKCNSIEEALDIGKSFETEQKALQHILLNWESYIQNYDSEIIFVHIPNDTGMTSLFSSIISYMFAEKTFVFYQFNSEHQAYYLSLRSQKSQIHLGELAREVSTQLRDSNGGGHKPAAGLLCHKQEIDLCLKKIAELYIQKINSQ